MLKRGEVGDVKGCDARTCERGWTGRCTETGDKGEVRHLDTDRRDEGPEEPHSHIAHEKHEQSVMQSTTKMRQAVGDHRAKMSPERNGTIKHIWIPIDGETRACDTQRYDSAEQMEERWRESKGMRTALCQMAGVWNGLK